MNWTAFIEALRKEAREAEDRAHRKVVSPSPAAEVLMALHHAFSVAIPAVHDPRQENGDDARHAYVSRIAREASL